MKVKNEVKKQERRVLKELGFCVHIKHPHKVFRISDKPECFSMESNKFVLNLAHRNIPENVGFGV